MPVLLITAMAMVRGPHTRTWDKMLAVAAVLFSASAAAMNKDDVLMTLQRFADHGEPDALCKCLFVAVDAAAAGEAGRALIASSHRYRCRCVLLMRRR